MSEVPQSPPSDVITSFAVDNEGGLYTVRDFPDGTQIVEPATDLNKFAGEFRAAQAAHLLDPDNTTPGEPFRADVPQGGPNLDIIGGVVQTKKRERGEYIPPPPTMHVDDDGNVTFS